MSQLTARLELVKAFPWASDLIEDDFESFFGKVREFAIGAGGNSNAAQRMKQLCTEITHYRKRAEATEKQRHLEALLENT